LLFAVVDQFFIYISCISFWLFALWPSQYTLDDYKKKRKKNGTGNSKIDINLLPKCLAGPKISAKSQLLETIAANKWRHPSFECFKEGPWHNKMQAQKYT